MSTGLALLRCAAACAAQNMISAAPHAAFHLAIPISSAACDPLDRGGGLAQIGGETQEKTACSPLSAREHHIMSCRADLASQALSGLSICTHSKPIGAKHADSGGKILVRETAGTFRQMPARPILCAHRWGRGGETRPDDAQLSFFAISTRRLA